VRIVAACFGHQIVGRALGARVGRSEKGWETSVTAIDLTKRGQEIFGKTTLVSLFLLFILSYLCYHSLPKCGIWNWIFAEYDWVGPTSNSWGCSI